ncbi:hypothetical protein [Pseudonocardia spinosispora]|uniref:hypothetical protein n=1 Tax=Pseudonocardia spinosispora TaxID=103441 RepID=UPI0003F6389F|nr:hypothetical protein [Pseudonocardia spinosispora]
MRHPAGRGGAIIASVDTSNESYNPWTVVNLVFHHLADAGLHPTFSEAGDPGAHAAELLRALGIEPAAEGNRQDFERKTDELARIRAAMFGES